MKTGDIVKVTDGSYGLFYTGNGVLGDVHGIGLSARRFRVLLTGVTLPSNMPDTQNDTMLCEEAAPEQILFTQSRFCTIVSRPTTGDLNLDGYPEPEPTVAILDCLAGAREIVATLRAKIAVLGDTVQLLEQRATSRINSDLDQGLSLVDAALPNGCGCHDPR